MIKYFKKSYEKYYWLGFLVFAAFTVLLLCSSSAQQGANGSKQTVTDTGFLVTGWRYTAFVDSGINNVRMFNVPLGRDTFLYDAKNKAIYLKFWFMHEGKLLSSKDTMYVAKIAPSDSVYINKSIMGYELKGIFTKPIAFPWCFMYYIHPKTQNILRVSYKWYPGDIDDVMFFLRDSVNPIAGYLEEAKKYFTPVYDKERLSQVIRDTADDKMSTIEIQIVN